MSASGWQAQKHNGSRNSNIRLLQGRCNTAHAAESHIPVSFMQKNKKCRCGACTASQRHCLFFYFVCWLLEHTVHEEGYNTNLFE